MRTVRNASESHENLNVTMPNIVDNNILDTVFKSLDDSI